VRELQTLREGWETLEADETRLLRRMTVHESIRHWLALQRAFEPQLQQTAALFAPERQAALAELQTRLRRLAEWQEQYRDADQDGRDMFDDTPWRASGLRAKHQDCADDR
jgi:hypothetical protein